MTAGDSHQHVGSRSCVMEQSLHATDTHLYSWGTGDTLWSHGSGLPGNPRIAWRTGFPAFASLAVNARHAYSNKDTFVRILLNNM